VIGALRKLLNVLLVGLGHLLWLHLKLLFRLLGYDDWILCLRSWMKMHTMNMLACKVDECNLLYWVEYK
jgi:hypothetical protein